MSEQNMEAVRRLFKAVEERDLTGVLAAYDPEVVIREAESLPYGGVYRGIEGAERHARGYEQAWGRLQTPAERRLDATFLDAGEQVVVLWRQRGRAADGSREFDMPAVSVYRLRGGRVVESQMFHADASAVRRFLDG
jgi:uncharacterized protein